VKASRIALVPATVAALLVIAAPTLAGGRLDHYAGPINQDGRPAPTIELWVHTQRHRDGRVVVKITNTWLRNVYYHCPDGNNWYPGSAGGNQSGVQFPARITLVRRAFSKTTFSESVDLTIKGRIPKRGPASGTLKISGNGPGGRCHSGVLAWSATRQ
jgi:hypothetical protein